MLLDHAITFLIIVAMDFAILWAIREDKGKTIVSCPRCHAPAKITACGPHQCHACGHQHVVDQAG